MTPDLEDYMSDEDKDAIHNDEVDDDEYNRITSEAEERFEEEVEDQYSDPYSQDEKDEMGSQEFFDDNG